MNEHWQFSFPRPPPPKIRYGIFPSPQLVPSCSFRVHHPSPGNGFPIHSHTLIVSTLELHLEGFASFYVLFLSCNQLFLRFINADLSMSVSFYFWVVLHFVNGLSIYSLSFWATFCVHFFSLTLCVIFSDSPRNNIYPQLLSLPSKCYANTWTM